MCSWERFWTFARDPERRKVGGDARVAVEGVPYEVDPNLAGETVVLWWGLFDQDLYVEHGERRYGPYTPVGGPIPLHRSRRFKKTAYEQRADRIEALAATLAIPRAAVYGPQPLALPGEAPPPPGQPFPDPFHAFTYPSVLAAKRAIADALVLPLAKLLPEELAALETLLAQTLRKSEVLAYVRTHITPRLRGS
jgi:hypothetical protein